MMSLVVVIVGIVVGIVYERAAGCVRCGCLCLLLMLVVVVC